LGAGTGVGFDVLVDLTEGGAGESALWSAPAADVAEWADEAEWADGAECADAADWADSAPAPGGPAVEPSVLTGPCWMGCTWPWSFSMTVGAAAAAPMPMPRAVAAPTAIHFRGTFGGISITNLPSVGSVSWL
jgi:hypothetical protein